MFVEKLNECGDVKYEMSEIFSRVLGKLKDVYTLVFTREKRDFLALKNMMYFKGGVPDPDSRARLHETLDKFISLVNHYDFLEDDEIKGYLEEHGIEINVITPQIQDGPIVIPKEDVKKFERSWNFAMANIKVPETKKELLNEILDKSIETQKAIEDRKDKISEKAQDVDVECQVKKPFFMKALSIKVKELKKNSVDNEIKKVEDDIEMSRDIISVFDTQTNEELKE
jgi:hypothetical protein